MFFVLRLFFNNVINAIIDHVLNEIVFEFKLREILTIIVIKKFTTIIDVKKNSQTTNLFFAKKSSILHFSLTQKLKYITTLNIRRF